MISLKLLVVGCLENTLHYIPPPPPPPPPFKNSEKSVKTQALIYLSCQRFCKIHLLED